MVSLEFKRQTKVPKIPRPSMQQVQFAATECTLQQTSPERVYDMVHATVMAQSFRFARPRISISDVLFLGSIVEPIINANGFRHYNVTVDMRALPHGTIHANVTKLLDAFNTIEHPSSEDAINFYKAFEEIHPFIDGNGRVGAILYNWILNTLEVPSIPPDLFAHNDL